MSNSIFPKLCQTLAVSLGLLVVTPQPTLAFDLTRPATSFEEERQNSERTHVDVLKQFGGIYDDPDLSAYVDRVGQRVAAVSEMPDKPFIFTVLNTPMVNAFTTGGGYVYVTRGILASINSEAELAALLGHEIGHVTARHTARRETRMKQDRAAAIGLGLLTGSLSTAIIADGASDVMRQAYSRKQEAESDRLGVISMAKAGYDPSAMPTMLGALKREVGLMESMAGDQGGISMPAWLSDHPETDDRVTDTVRQVKRMKGKPANGEIGRDAHMDAIDGVQFGQDPQLGFMQGRTFVHPLAGVKFDLPQGYDLRDMQGALMAQKDDDGVVIFTAGRWPEDRELSEFALSAWYSVTDGDLGQLDDLRNLTVNGLSAVMATKFVHSRLINVTIAGTSIRLDEGLVAGVTLLTDKSPTDTQLKEYQTILESFRTLTKAEQDAVPNPSVTVVTVQPGDTVQSLSAQMLARTFKEERFHALNGIEGGVEAGMRVKIITDRK
ncbi:M48 family metalloprotease [uncultured Pelagimonas sp.]|uniref:M48 family metalloprotease n=1 Tax=uncultured Pelagimonas sp. TaxID=1618102 RepID=UPI00260BBE67|nr:M48 family metalloprotease [uncultured Pelagimonas sp.]